MHYCMLFIRAFPEGRMKPVVGLQRHPLIDPIFSQDWD